MDLEEFIIQRGLPRPSDPGEEETLRLIMHQVLLFEEIFGQRVAQIVWKLFKYLVKILIIIAKLWILLTVVQYLLYFKPIQYIFYYVFCIPCYFTIMSHQIQISNSGKYEHS